MDCLEQLLKELAAAESKKALAEQMTEEARERHDAAVDAINELTRAIHQWLSDQHVANGCQKLPYTK